MDAPVFRDPDLLRRVETVEARYMATRLRGLAEALGADAVRTERFGSAHAQCVAGRDGFCQVYGLESDGLEHLAAIEAFFAGQPFVLHVLPLDSNGALTHALAKRGYVPDAFDAMYCADPRTLRGGMRQPADALRVRRIERGELDVYTGVLARAWENPPEQLPLRQRELAAQYGGPEWRLFLAEVGEQPIAAAALYVNEDDAALEMCATLPEARGRGAQGALIHARLAEAARAGCELAVSTPYLFSASQRNLERAGMQLAYHKTLWTRAEAARG